MSFLPSFFSFVCFAFFFHLCYLFVPGFLIIVFINMNLILSLSFSYIYIYIFRMFDILIIFGGHEHKTCRTLTYIVFLHVLLVKNLDSSCNFGWVLFVDTTIGLCKIGSSSKGSGFSLLSIRHGITSTVTLLTDHRGNPYGSLRWCGFRAE